MSTAAGPGPRDGFVAAAGRFVPVRAYDAIVAATMRERRWRPVIAKDLAAGAASAGRSSPTVVEVGAGTGSLTAALALALPRARITAVDADARALAIARAKAPAADVDWRVGRAEALPLDDGGVDAVVMALLLHHLGTPDKARALAEARRVLRPGGRLYVADFGRPQDPLMAAAFTVIQVADGFAPTGPHRRGALPAAIEAAGFAGRTRLARVRTAGGTLEVHRAELAG